MNTPEERRDERRQFEADVHYEVWRAGGNPDRVDPDRISEKYCTGQSHEDVARQELRRQRPKEPEQVQEQEQICGACGCPIDQWGCGCNPPGA